MIFRKAYLNKVCFLILCLIGLKSLSQANFKHYTSSDGLPHDVTYNIIQDAKGYVWIGTDDGLAKFDGDSFKNYTLDDGLTSNYVTDIEELPNGKLAIATWGGGLHFFKNDSIYKLTTFPDKNLKIYDIDYFDGKIYTYSGVSNVVYNLKNSGFTTKQFLKRTNGFGTQKDITDTIYKISTTKLNSRVYVHNLQLSAPNYLGVKRFSDFKLAPAFSFLSNYNITAALYLGKDQYVFGAVNNLVFSDEEHIKSTFQIPNINPNEFIHKILQAPENRGEYVLVIQNEQREKRIISVNISSGEIVDLGNLLDFKTTISDAMFDFEGNLWISTFGDGVYCFYYSNPKIKSYFEGDYIIDLMSSKSKIYAQAASKLYEFENESLVNSYTVQGFPKQLSIKDGKLTIAILNKAMDDKPWFNIINGRFYKETDRGFFKQSDTLFFNDKVLMVSNEVLVNKAIEEDSLVNFYTNKGKWQYHYAKGIFKKDTYFHKGLPSENVKDIVIDGDVTYLATDRGLVIKKGDSLKVFREGNGLQNERVNCIFIRNNIVYLGTQQGLSVIKQGKVYNFSKSFGIKSLAINKIIYYGNNLWLAGNNGISVVNINDIKMATPPKLNVVQKGSHFVYDAITYQDRNAIITQYKINNGKWVGLNTNNGNVDFSNYAPNTYKVQFRSQNSYSPWSASKSYTFTIKPPWYKVWWVILLFVIVVLAIAFLLFYKRLAVISNRNAILKREIDKRILAEKELGEVRDNIARDFHDDLGNKLASISLMSDVLVQQVASKNRDVVTTIKNDADYLYKGTRDFIFSLQEKSNYLKELQIYLTDFAEDYFHQFGIEFEVESNVEPNIKLPHYWSKHIIYIFKEAITNAVKHSEAKFVKMIFDCSKNQLKIQLMDYGRGFNLAGALGNGLLNMKSRAKKINCSLDIESLKDKGTTITFYGKLPQKGS